MFHFDQLTGFDHHPEYSVVIETSELVEMEHDKRSVPLSCIVEMEHDKRSVPLSCIDAIAARALAKMREGFC